MTPTGRSTAATNRSGVTQIALDVPSVAADDVGMTAVLTHSHTADPALVAPAGATRAAGVPAPCAPRSRHRHTALAAPDVEACGRLPGDRAVVAEGAGRAAGDVGASSDGGHGGAWPAASVFELVTTLAILESLASTRRAAANAAAAARVGGTAGSGVLK